MPQGNGTSVVIVGNGDSLTGGLHGAAIDAFDLVCRFNLFRIDGFEADVGRKANVWFINRPNPHPWLLHNAEKFPFWRIYCASREPDSGLDLALRRHSSAMVIPVSQQVRQAMTTFEEHGYWSWSTGAVGAWIMAQEFGHVSIIGFDWWNSPTKLHYSDHQVFTPAAHGHVPATEKAFFHKMQDQGLLTFLDEAQD